MQALLRSVNLRELRLIILGVGALITGGVFAGLLLPKAKLLSTTNTAVAVLREASEDGAELTRHMQKQQEQIDALKYRLHGDMADVPPQQVESYIIGRLQKVSWNNNVELVSVQPALGEQIQVFQEMLFKVQLIGQYEDIYGWLWEARSDLGFVVIKELRLTRHDQLDENPLLQASLSLASYRGVE